MGFLRRLFGGSKNKSPSPTSTRTRTRRSLNTTTTNSLPSNQHAIAVAAATAAVAEAALAAAQAAAEVVRLTTATAHQRSLEQSVAAAAVKIQSAFRAYLARRALRALKALVKLQALVRGHIVRKQMANMLRRMQTLVRLQRARANRSDSTASSLSSIKSSLSQYPKSLSTANYRGSSDIGRAKSGSNWLDRWMEESVVDNSNSDGPVRNNRHEDEWSAKILEVDTWKPHFNSQTNHGSCEASVTRSYNAKYKYMNTTLMPFDIPSKYLSQPSNPVPSLSSEEVASLRSLKLPKGKGSAENSPQVVMRGSLTPTRSECSWGCLSSYSGHPNYMANTESSRAKVRSQSAPRHRVQVERYGSLKRTVVEGTWDGRSTTNSERSCPVYSNQWGKIGIGNMR